MPTINYGSFKQEVDDKGRWLINFSAALAAMKRGEKVARSHWGGYWFIPGNWESTLFVGDMRYRFNPMIVACLKDDGGFAPATPYMEDLLAEDWVVIGREKEANPNEIVNSTISHGIGANPVMIGGGSISATTIHASEIKGITTTPAGLLMMEEDDGCCVDEANGTQPGDIYQLTEALRALDKDYDNTARAKIIDKMLQVLGL